MGMQNSGWQSAGARLEDLSNISIFSGGAPISRASLLATASSAAQAQFGGTSQIISGSVVGPVLSNGGAITVTTTGSVTSPSGVTGLVGVDVTVYSTTTLTNNGAISGGAGTAAGGAGVSNSATTTITTLTNSGAISGGASLAHGGPGDGGAGVSNFGMITTLTNSASGKITGGSATGTWVETGAPGYPTLARSRR